MRGSAGEGGACPGALRRVQGCGMCSEGLNVPFKHHGDPKEQKGTRGESRPEQISNER